jgi:hypothetical protein
MDEIAIQTEPAADRLDSETSEDISREEERWTGRHESFLSDMQTQCTSLSKEHKTQGQYAQWMFRSLSLPAITIPLVAGFITQVGPDLPVWIPSGLILISTAIGSVNAVLNYGKRAQKHFEYLKRKAVFFNNYFCVCVKVSKLSLL